MTKRPLKKILLPALLFTVVSTSLCQKTPVVVMQEIQCLDLNKRSVSLPRDLPGKKGTLVLIAFQREQQSEIDTWIKGLALKNSELPWIELPVIDDPGFLGRWFIDSGMRRGIPGEDIRARVFTVYTDKKVFLASLGIISEAQIYAFVIDASGRVLGREEGTFEKEKAARLMKTLAN